MQSEDHRVLASVRDWLAAGETVYLCTIVETYGSSPRPVGSLLAVTIAGELVGSLSGGCVEDDLIEQLRAGTLVDAAPRRLDYGLAPEDTEKLGLPCGGHLGVVAERLEPDPARLARFTTIVERLERRECTRREVVLDAGGAERVDPVAAFEALRLDASADGTPRLRQVFGPRHHLFLIGAGMVSRYLAEMALALNYDVTVCDPREEMIAQWAVPGTRERCAMPDDAIREHAADARTAIIALTHDPRIDDMALMEALETDAFYVGAMGSERTSANRRARLTELDVPAAALARLHAPVGLPIGSRTPAEIAIAILAELTQEIRRGAGAVPQGGAAAAG